MSVRSIAAAAVILCSLVVGSAPAQAQNEYAVMANCGNPDIVPLSSYASLTDIYVHNQAPDTVELRLSVAVPGGTTHDLPVSLVPGAATVFRCADLLRFLPGENSVQGFAIIVSRVPLDVVAVYTVLQRSGLFLSVGAAYMERIQPRRHE